MGVRVQRADHGKSGRGLAALRGHGVVAELEKRTGAERRRETEYLDAVSTLFETQDRLSRQLEILLRRVASLNAERSGGREQGRAIA